MNNIDIDYKWFEDMLYSLINLQNSIVWQTNETVKQKLVTEFLEKRSSFIRSQASDFRRMEKEANRIKEEQRIEIFGEVVEKENDEQVSQEDIQSKKEKFSRIEKQIDNILLKHEYKMLNLLEQVGIIADDFKLEDGSPIKASQFRKKSKMECDVENGIYTYTDKKGNITIRKANKDLWSSKAKKAFVNKILRKYAMRQMQKNINSKVLEEETRINIISRRKVKVTIQELQKQYINSNKNELVENAKQDCENHRKQFELLAEFVDINLYNFYNEINPRYADSYILALDVEEKAFMPTELEYQEGKDKLTQEDYDKIQPIPEMEKVRPITTPPVAKSEHERIEENRKDNIEESKQFVKMPEETPKADESYIEDKVYEEAIMPDEYIDLDEEIRIEKMIEKLEENNKRYMQERETKTEKKKRQKVFSNKNRKALMKKAKEHFKLGIASLELKSKGLKAMWTKIATALGLTKTTLALASGQSEIHESTEENVKDRIKVDADKLLKNTPIVIEKMPTNRDFEGKAM